MSRRLVLTKSELWAHSDHVTIREGKQKDLGTGEGVVWLCLWVLRPLAGKEVCEGGAELVLHVCVRCLGHTVDTFQKLLSIWT